MSSTSGKLTARTAIDGVDVLLVTYNSAGCIRSAVEAARRFCGERLASLVVVDNASRDDTVAVVRSAAPDANIVRNSQNLGFAAAVNRGLAVCTADLVMLLNPDVLSIEGTVGTAVALFDDEQVGAVAGALFDEDGRQIRSCHTEPGLFSILSETLSLHRRFPRWSRARRYLMLDWDMQTQRDVDDACGAMLFLRRAAVSAVGAFDERFFLYSEETDWLLRARRRGWILRYTPLVRATHASGGSSEGASAALTEHLIESRYKYLRKHHGRLVEIAGRALLTALDGTRLVVNLPSRRYPEREGKRNDALLRLKMHLGLRKARRPA